MAEALAPQDHLYTLVERGTASPAPQSSAASSTTAWPTRIRRCRRRSSADPGRGHRVAHRSPRRATAIAPTAPRLDAHGLRRHRLGLDRRRQAGHAPLTIVSCDNLPGNGDVARRSTLGAARRWSASLAEWVDSHCAFPNSMVDRITPATSDADRAWLLDAVGIDGPLAGRRRAVPAMGHRGRLRRRPAALGGRRRAVHRSRPRLGAVQAAPAQRRPLVHGLPRRARRGHLRRRGDGAPRGAPLPRAPPPSTRPSRRCRRSRPPAARLRRLGARPLRQHRRPRPDRPAVHRRQPPSSRRSCSRRSRSSSTHGGPIAPQRAGAGRLGPVPGRRPAGRAGLRRRSATRRGSTPGGPPTTRPASSTSPTCSRERSRQRTASASPSPPRGSASATWAPSPRWATELRSQSLEDGAAPMTTTDSTRQRHHRVAAAPSSSIIASGRSTCSR